MRSAFAHEERVTALRIVNLAADMEPRGALEDVERLVLGVMDMQRRWAGRRDGDLEDGESVSRVVAADSDVD
jgi:hypothetical protein